MNGAVVRGALWANELGRLQRPPLSCGGYALIEVRNGRLSARLAEAMEVGPEVVLERLGRGCRVYIAYAGTEVVSWLWVSIDREWAPPLRQDLHFGTDECYGWTAGTLARHRGCGIFTGLLRVAGWRMGQEGYRLMWNGILDENLPSRRAHVAAGMRPVLRLTAIHEPAPTRLRVRPADYADPELVRRARRILVGESRPAAPGPGGRGASAGCAACRGGPQQMTVAHVKWPR